ncbi:MAG: diacylglycerol kinase family protein [Oscillospiraceae bacterium]|jgi:diacylglycerol kinase|nr:diacylglycerol kinase family protein [Oscillospiraceae bacterium]
MRFLKSLKSAARGILFCINQERHMRFHTVAAFYTLLFSPFFELDRPGYATLLLAIGSVLAAEVFNTAAEAACDIENSAYNRGVRLIKDMAAGAVLMSAAFAAGVGLCLFAKPACIAAGWFWLCARPWLLLLLGLSAAAAFFYVRLGPGPLWRKLRALFGGKG